MKVIALLVSFASFVAGGVIHDGEHHPQATSYQSIHMEHFHPVPTYAHKEGMHYLEHHPVSEGKTESKIQVFHGNKHEPGYAVAEIHSDIHGHHGGHNFVAAGGHAYGHDDHHEEHHDEHQVEDHGDPKEYAPTQYHGGYSEEAQDGGHEETEGHGSQEEGGHYHYGQEAAHDGDEHAAYYHDGGHDDGEEARGSYERGHEESAERY